jgi:hypothetical protein
LGEKAAKEAESSKAISWQQKMCKKAYASNVS